MTIIILDLEVGAYFFFHGSLVGRRYNIMYYYCTVYRTPFVGTTIPSLADNTSATDNRWYRLSNVFSASTTRQSLSHRVVYLSRATNFRRPFRKKKKPFSHVPVRASVPSTSDASDPSTWRSSRGDGRQHPERLASPESDRC